MFDAFNFVKVTARPIVIRHTLLVVAGAAAVRRRQREAGPARQQDEAPPEDALGRRAARVERRHREATGRRRARVPRLETVDARRSVPGQPQVRNRRPLGHDRRNESPGRRTAAPAGYSGLR